MRPLLLTPRCCGTSDMSPKVLLPYAMQNMRDDAAPATAQQRARLTAAGALPLLLLAGATLMLLLFTLLKILLLMLLLTDHR